MVDDHVLKCVEGYEGCCRCDGALRCALRHTCTTVEYPQWEGLSATAGSRPSSATAGKSQGKIVECARAARPPVQYNGTVRYGRALLSQRTKDMPLSLQDNGTVLHHTDSARRTGGVLARGGEIVFLHVFQRTCKNN